MQSDTQARHSVDSREDPPGDPHLCAEPGGESAAQSATVPPENVHDPVEETKVRPRAKKAPHKIKSGKPPRSSKTKGKCLATNASGGDKDVSTENNSTNPPEASAGEQRAEKPAPRPKKRSKKKQKYGSFTRRLWGDDEDEAIIKLVDKYGIRKWTLISRRLQEEYQIHGRSGKQCRERYGASDNHRAGGTTTSIQRSPRGRSPPRRRPSSSRRRRSSGTSGPRSPSSSRGALTTSLKTTSTRR